jgi:hypothetical protein
MFDEFARDDDIKMLPSQILDLIESLHVAADEIGKSSALQFRDSFGRQIDSPEFGGNRSELSMEMRIVFQLDIDEMLVRAPQMQDFLPARALDEERVSVHTLDRT